jgi:hypothetical protein
MTFSPVAKPSVNPALMRQVRSGKSAGITAKPVAANQPPDAPAPINLSDDHPAAIHVETKPAAETSVPDKGSVAQSPVKSSRFSKIAITTAEKEPEPVESEPIVEPKGRFDAVADMSNSTKAKQAKVNMAAAKALTPLVAAISFNPGSRSEPAAKSKVLADMVCKVQQSTTDVALVMGPYFANNEWARGNLMITLAGIAAQQWEKHGRVDLDQIGTCMSGAFKAPSAEIQSALESFESGDSYKKAETPDIAKARLSVTICSAAWELNEWVTHERLQLKGSRTEKFSNGESFPTPSRVFSYNISTAEIVEILLSRIIDESRAFEIQVQDADMRLAHLQGTVRRMSQIAGAEYVTQTAAIAQWIGDGPNEDEQVKRTQMAQEQFHTQLIPRVMEWTRANFASIEHRAQRILTEMTQEKSNADKNRQATR